MRYSRQSVAWTVFMVIGLIFIVSLFLQWQDTPSRRVPDGSSVNNQTAAAGQGMLARLLALGQGLWQGLRSDSHSASTTPPVKPKFDQYTRQVFFYDLPNLGSLALPLAWRTKYEQVEASDTITFNYAPFRGQSWPLFQIQAVKYQGSITGTSAKRQLLGQASGYGYFYESFNARISSSSLSNEYQAMRHDLGQIKASFRLLTNKKD